VAEDALCDAALRELRAGADRIAEEMRAAGLGDVSPPNPFCEERTAGTTTTGYDGRFYADPGLDVALRMNLQTGQWWAYWEAEGISTRGWSQLRGAAAWQGVEAVGADHIESTDAETAIAWAVASVRPAASLLRTVRRRGDPRRPNPHPGQHELPFEGRARPGKPHAWATRAQAKARLKRMRASAKIRPLLAGARGLVLEPEGSPRFRVYITRGVRGDSPTHPWQVTTFDSTLLLDGTVRWSPVGHTVAASLEEAVRDVQREWGGAVKVIERANPGQEELFPAQPEPAPASTPDLRSYDHVIVAFSGGKDSMASLVHVLETALAQGRDLRAEGAIELWHHDVDSPEESGGFMDWPVTASYVRAIGAALGIPVYFSWKVGGFYGELTRKDARTLPTRWEEPGGKIGQSGGTSGTIATRMKFPQVSADLKTRWCSPYEESPGRSRYKTFEHERTHLPGKRHVDHWRPVHAWTTAQVWDAIRRWGIVPHPAYRAGFGRVSCAFCIFGSADQWATLRELLPTGFDRIAELERRFGRTIQRKETVEARAARGHAYAILNADVEEGRRLAVQRDYDAPILVTPEAWVMPAGAFAEGAGPT
jgi:3'-phosphoadenosine 5'-phosphosulfate sulfotransferase (PAPS reductase)/FAD synthetase